MFWSEMKSFIDSQLCNNQEEIVTACQEFAQTITVEKCRNYIRHLKEKVIPRVIELNGHFSDK
jgi:hypothetical protein